LSSSEPGAGPGTLYLVPVTLGDEDARARLPRATLETAQALRYFFAENA
jgi:hypothetical protein